MAFQLNAFQGSGFQMPKQDNRPSGGYGQAWVTYDNKRTKMREKRAVMIRSDEDILAVIKAFVDEVL